MAEQSEQPRPMTRPLIRLEECYQTFACDYPGCAGLGARFAIWMRSGRMLGHYCDAHTVEEITDQWRDWATIEAAGDLPGVHAFYREQPPLSIHSRPDGERGGVA